MDATNANQTSLRELDSRVNDGIHVQLLWSSTTNRLSVAVNDTRTGQSFSVEVPDSTSGMDVFMHPFAYAPSSATR